MILWQGNAAALGVTVVFSRSLSGHLEMATVMFRLSERDLCGHDIALVNGKT